MLQSGASKEELGAELEMRKAGWSGLVPGPSTLSSCMVEDVHIASTHIAYFSLNGVFYKTC